MKFYKYRGKMIWGRQFIYGTVTVEPEFMYWFQGDGYFISALNIDIDIDININRVVWRHT